MSTATESKGSFRREDSSSMSDCMVFLRKRDGAARRAGAVSISERGGSGLYGTSSIRESETY